MRTLGLLVLGAIVACDAPARRDDTWESHANQLAGQWTARFDFDLPLQPSSDSAVRRTSVGTISLTANRTIDAALPRIGIPTNYGTYDIDFAALGRKPSGDQVPAVVVGVTRGDSVEFNFDTDRAAFTMTLRAPLTADSIRGRWVAMQSRFVVGSGGVLLTRH